MQYQINMGSTLSRIEQSGSRSARILVLGLDDAGKTTFLYKLKLNLNVKAIPTVGFNVEEITPVKNVTFIMWDVSGQENFRPFWRQYYKGSEGLLFVIDSSAASRVEEARKELFSILKDEAMEAGVPTVILANKQDLPNALKSQELIDKLGLEELKTNPLHVQEVCAVTGEGLYEAVEIMADMVQTFRKGKRPSFVNIPR